MTNPTETAEEAREKFWAALARDMTVMLGTENTLPRPMTAQVTDDAPQGPIWFFTSIDTDLGQGPFAAAYMNFVDKGHNLWSNVRGTLTISNDRAMVDALWNPHVAAWYEEGKDDPKLVLLRFEPEEAKIWFDASSLFAGLKVMLGHDPKKDFENKVVEVSL